MRPSLFFSCQSMIKPVKTIQKLSSGSPVTIAAIGDSLTASWMVRRGYIDFFKDMLQKQYPATRINVVARGVPGDTADSGTYRLKWDILEYKPDCVLIQYALNDAFLGFTAGQFRGYIREMIEAVREDPETDVVLLTSSYMGSNADNGFVEEFYQQLIDLGNEYNLAVSLTHRYWKAKMDGGETDFQSLVQYDMVHPTERGYRLMAEALMSLFV
jgi:acyl-CoA thioesterase I